MSYCKFDEGHGICKGEKESEESRDAKRLFKTIRLNIEGMLEKEGTYKMMFTTRFSESEKKRLLKENKGDFSDEEYLERIKDAEFKNLIGRISDIESQYPYSILVFTGVKVSKMSRFDYGGNFERYYSLEEYLSKSYSEEDFELYVTASNELVVRFEDRCCAIIVLKPEGDLLYRAMMHEREKKSYRVHMIDIYKEIFQNRKVIMRSNILTKFERPHLPIRGNNKFIIPKSK